MNTTPAPTGTRRRGLRVSVYRNADSAIDTTRGGISFHHTQVTLVGIVRHQDNRADQYTLEDLPRASQPTEPHAEAPAVWLVLDRHRGGSVHLIPALPNTDPDLDTWWMFGGNLAFTSDGRWVELVRGYAGVRIHDRCEARHGIQLEERR